MRTTPEQRARLLEGVPVRATAETYIGVPLKLLIDLLADVQELERELEKERLKRAPRVVGYWVEGWPPV